MLYCCFKFKGIFRLHKRYTIYYQEKPGMQVISFPSHDQQKVYSYNVPLNLKSPVYTDNIHPLLCSISESIEIIQFTL